MPCSPTVAAAHCDNHQTLVNSDPFWPTIDLGRLREQLRLPAEVSHARLEVAARVATAKAAREFCGWRQALRGQGYRSLLELSGDGERPSLAELYRRAVQEATRFELNRHLAQVEHTPQGRGKAL